MAASRKQIAFLAIPLEIMFLQVGFFFAGRWLDERLGTAPIYTVVGPILGFVLWLIHVVIMIRGVSRNAAALPPEEPQSPKE